MVAKKILKKQTPEGIKILEDFKKKNNAQTTRVGKMEDLVHNFDVQHIIDLNDRLRVFYEKIGDEKVLSLLDQMTTIMRELTEIINQVKSKRVSLEQGQREIQEKLADINEVLKTLQDWEATGI